MGFSKQFSGFVIILFLSVRSYGQEVSLAEGSFKVLASEKTAQLVFTYDSLQVGKYKVESDYVNKKVTEMNKKYPGKGDEWDKEWIAQRKEKFEPAFTQAFKAASGITVSSPAKYTLIFHTTYIEQGFSTAGIMVHKNPEVRGDLILVETADPTKIVARARITKAMGKAGPHFETGDHVDAAYDAAGRSLGEFILNN
jgi:hypothetical protein